MRTSLKWITILTALLAVTACSGGSSGSGVGSTEVHQDAGRVGTGGGTSSNAGTPLSGGISSPSGPTIIQFPDGTNTLVEGGVTQPDGSIKFPDGIDTAAKAVVPVAALADNSDVKDGSVFPGQKEVTAKAKEQAGVTYAWTLEGPGFKAPQKGAGAAFNIGALPAATSADKADQYVLTLTVTASGKSNVSKILFQVVPPALPKIKLSNGKLADNGTWPTKVLMEFTAAESLFTDPKGYSWMINTPEGDQVCPPFKEGPICQFTPTKAGQYAVMLTATGPGGKSTAPAEFLFNGAPGLPGVAITGIVPGAVAMGPVNLSGDVTPSPSQGPNDPVIYSWTGIKDGLVGIEKAASEQTAVFKDPGVYEIHLKASMGGVSGNVAVINFTILPPLTAIILDQNNKPLPLNIALKSLETLHFTSNATPDYGAMTNAWTVTSPSGETTSSNDLTTDVTFNELGQYTIALMVKTQLTGGVNAPSVTVTALAKARAQIEDIEKGLSYLKRPFQVNGSNSKGATEAAWSLTYTGVDPNVVELDVPFAAVQPGTWGWSFFPKDFGSYVLKLDVKNEVGPGAPAEVAFNVRVAEGQAILPFTPETAKSVYALNSNDLYVGGDIGLMHYGADKQWIRFKTNALRGAIDAIWARSSNEVYAAVTINGLQQIRVYSAKEGWDGAALVPLGPAKVTALAGSPDRLVALCDDQNIRVYQNAAWLGPVGDQKIQIMTVLPDGTIFAATSDNVLLKIDAQMAVTEVKKIIELPVNNQWTAMTAAAATKDTAAKIYLANAGGSIMRSVGEYFSFIQGLPKDQAGQAQYAKALWKVNEDTFHAVTQTGAVYVMAKNGGEPSEDSISDSGGIQVSQAFAGNGLLIAVDPAGIPYFLNRVKVADQVSGKWTALFPSNVSPVMQTVVGDAYLTTARRSSETVYILNATTTIDGNVSTLQQITSDGQRQAVPIGVPITDLCGVDDAAYFATANGLLYYDGSNPPVALAAAGLPDVKAVKAVGCVSPDMFFVLTKTAVYRTTDGGQNFAEYVTPSPKALGNAIEATGLGVLPDGSIVLGTSETGAAGTPSISIFDADKKPVGALVEVFGKGLIMHIVGSDLDHLYAITRGVVGNAGTSAILKYDKAGAKWDVVDAGANAKDFKYHDIQATDDALYFEADKDEVKVNLADGKVVGTGPAFTFHAQGTQDFVYSGFVPPDQNGNPVAAGAMMLFRKGPMQ